MESIDLQPLTLYWALIWAVLGSALTPLMFDRRKRNPWTGALAGITVGIISGQVFGWLIVRVVAEVSVTYAPWVSILGGAVLLVPMWIWLPHADNDNQQMAGIVPSVVSPLLFFLITLSLFPMIWAVTLAFFEYSPRNEGGAILGLGDDNPYIGLSHFEEMIEGETRNARIFENSLKNTLIFTALVLPLNLLLTIPLANLIESTHDRVKSLFRAVYFLPVVTSSVGVAVMWAYIFNAQYGLLNEGVKAVGATPVSWLFDPSAEVFGLPAAMVAVVVAYLWQDFGYNLVIFIAALQNIPTSLKDAAMIDGASPFQVFWHITLPLLRPTILVASVLTLISSFQVFDIIQVMTEGGPGRVGETRVLVLDIYENAFRFEQMGWAAAMSLVLVGIVLLATVFQLRFFRTTWEY